MQPCTGESWKSIITAMVYSRWLNIPDADVVHLNKHKNKLISKQGN